jgi:tetratricopeptide (TPR) repeat protein
MAGPLGNLGNVAQIQGDLGRARAYFEEALAIAREFDNLHWQSTALTCLGSVTFAQEDFAASRVYAEAALDICRQTGKRDVESAALRLLGIITRRQSSPREALRFYEQALVIHRELGQSSQEWTTLYNMASAYDILGEIGSAGELFCQALSLIKEGGDLRAIAPTLEGIAHFLAAHSPNFLKSACRLLGAADSLREEGGTPYTADEQDIYNKVVAKARHSLPPKTISTAAEEGRAMTVSPAIAYAIRETQALREAILREPGKGPGPAIQA